MNAYISENHDRCFRIFRFMVLVSWQESVVVRKTACAFTRHYWTTASVR